MERISIIDGLSITREMIGIERLGVMASKKECFAFIDKYLEAGGNCIDTARLYNAGETDRVLGEWLRSYGKRDQVVLCTKGSHNDPDGRPRLTPENIAADLDDALHDIGIEYTDIHLLHRDNLLLPVSEIMPVLDRIVRSGKARAVGVSNWTVSRIIEANRFAAENGLVPISASQIQYSLAVTTPAATGDLTHIVMNDVEYGWYRESRLPVLAYSAQARGYFIKRSKGEELRPTVLKYYDNFPENHRRTIRIQELAAKRGCSVAEICIAYVLCSGLNTSALLTVSNLEQLKDAFRAEQIKLTPDEIRYLEHGE